jgi:hypothetical protein
MKSKATEGKPEAMDRSPSSCTVNNRETLSVIEMKKLIPLEFQAAASFFV